MSDFVTSGRILDLVILLTVLEFLALMVYRRRTGRGVDPGAIAAPLASGIFLVLAFRLHTLGFGWIWIALCLIGAFLTHAIDLRRRWQG